MAPKIPGGVSDARRRLLQPTVREAARQKFGDSERWPEMLSEMSATFPFKRFGQPEEVADLVVYLASGRASYISSTIVNIDGGQSYRPGNY